MEACVIVTYRCNARCQMCYQWQKPSNISEEISPVVLEQLPDEIDVINISGGEPALRSDLIEIVSILRKKSKKIDISTNGYFTDRLVQVGERFPDLCFRISVEGLPELNDSLRGIKNGFDRALRSLIRLKEVGVKNVGFGIVISDQNKDALLDIYRLCVMMNIEFGSSTMHNSFYFNKWDNKILDIDGTVEVMKKFIVALLTSKRPNLRLRIKDWFRAYLNYGIMQFIKGETRPIKCGAGRELFFVDPYGQILACNGSEEPWVMGNLTKQSFEDIWRSQQADSVREKVSICKRNCWMVGSARPAMRSHPWIPLLWVLRNKIKLLIGKEIWC